MTQTPRTPILSCLLALAFGARAGIAQTDFSKEEQELSLKASRTLLSFASTARSNKVGQRAKQAYDLVISYYDPDNSQARSALGFRKNKGNWEALPPDKRKPWVDKASYEARFKIAAQWYDTCVKLGNLHRELGLKEKAAGAEDKAKVQLERAVYYNALDKDANLALGYKQGNGFYGTDEQIAFVERMRELETKAIEIAKTDYKVEALPQESMPIELQNTKEGVPDFLKKPSFDICGARSEHFTVWTRGTQENADNCCKWGERALDFGVYLLGAENAKKLHFVEQASKSFAWYGFLWTAREREEFLKANPHVWEKDGSMDRAKDFANNIWRAKEGTAVVLTKLTPAQMHDTMIGYVFKYGLVIGRSDGIGEGIVHAATWYLQSTSISRWGARPTGTVSDAELDLPETTNWWLRAIRDQAVSNQDLPIDLVAREQLERFRNDVRLKSWSFMTWAFAAYPDKWLPFFLKLPGDRIPFPEEIDKIGEEAFGKKLVDIEAEWREWARGDSGVAAATGYGPPLLPERPSKEEVAVLDRLNQVRAQDLAFSWPKDESPTTGTFAGLPPCELDAEASMACEAHAHFLTMHPKEHLKWPEAHEENPALEGFTPRGMRAGMSSVIIHREGNGGVEFAKDSVDGWIGTPYHRFPLLEQNIRRFGYSYVYENGLSVAVLDMGSLEEPYDAALAPRLIAWPPANMKDVPTRFHGIEHPNPLQDQPEDQQDITKTGYPISLQLQRELAVSLADSDIHVYEAHNRGKQPQKNLVPEHGGPEYKQWTDRAGKEVPTWVHTPKVPLNKRMEIRDVIFAIPKEQLEPNKSYQVRVRLQMAAPDPLYFFWEFSTGSQREGLRLK